MEGARRARPSGKPLTRDISVGSASQETQATRRSCAVLLGDQKRSARGSVDHSVVVVDRFGCRNRQAARGLRALRRKACGHVEGLAPPVRKHRKSERAPDAGSTVAKPRVRWRALLESTCRWKTLRVAKPCPLTGVRGSSSSVSGVRATASRGAGCEASEVKSHSLARGRKRRGKAASPGAVLCPPFQGSAVRDLPEVGPRRQTRVHLRLG